MKKKVFFGILAILLTLFIMGCGDDNDDKDKDKDKVPPFTGKVLKVTGIPNGTVILGAALMTRDTFETRKPSIASANANGTFNLYNVSFVEGSDIPVFGQPWNGTGEYFIALSTAMNASGDQYIYTGGKEIISLNTNAFLSALLPAMTAALQDPNTQVDFTDPDSFEPLVMDVLSELGEDAITINTAYNITSKTTTLAWSGFKKVDFDITDENEIAALLTPQIEQLLEAYLSGFKLEVSDIDPDDGITAAALLNPQYSPAAVALNIGGNFNFFPIDENGINFFQPFTADSGSYYVLLVAVDLEIMLTGEFLADPYSMLTKMMIYGNKNGIIPTPIPSQVTIDDNELTLEYKDFIDFTQIFNSMQ